MVLGAVLLALIVLFVSCSGGADDKPRGQGASSQPAVPPAGGAAGTSASAEPEPSFADAGPGGEPARPLPEEVQSPATTLTPPVAPTSTATGTGQNANVVIPPDGSCADAEVAVTPIPASTTVRRGVPVQIRLKVKNLSSRKCKRDLGAEAQELYVDQGARKAWSSDTCSADRRSDVRELIAGAEFEYVVTWNGKQATKCTAGLAAGPAPDAGQYELRGRLGTKVSEPVQLAITS